MHPNKAKGDRAERASLGWYRAEGGFPGAERTRAGYQRDAGDLHLCPGGVGGPGVIAQVKDWGSPAWTEWLAGLAEQRITARADHAHLVIKRRGVGDPGQWLAVMTVAEHARLLRAAGYGTPLDLGGVA